MDEQKIEMQQQTPPAQPTQKKKSGLATAGLVLGIIGISTSFIPIVNNASFFLGILAAIFGIIVLIKRTDKTKSIVALILGVLAIIITLVMQDIWMKAVDDAFDELDNELGYMVGDKTEDILNNYLDVSIGEFKVIEDEYFDESEMSITLKNKGAERKSFDVTIEAVDASGNRIATDTIYVSDLGAGQSQTVKVFTLITEEEMEALKTATFKISSASMY